MFVVDECGFECLEPVCEVCGDLLTMEEWEILGDRCFFCLGESEFMSLYC